MDRKDQFSYEGQEALFNYLEDYEEDTGQEVEFDVIALCCEYTEYDNLKELQEAYSDEYETLEYLEDTTQVIRIPDTERFIILDF
jgi:hypothetical protein